ncbi:archaeosortase/exosortase family protein [Synechococcus sp. PCC 7502]|uniref:archaeosortase/exosortase family protein n=1 Tax=Synechococcus sp. PCC 7502 TaxID=1173263 RepID=UPI0002DF3D59|nr:archaeosortase/exosortase family protein [Synechococcus sp. PCC 7502]
MLDRVLNFSLLAAKFVGVILYYANFDVVRKNVVLALPNGAIEVNSGCSGLPSIAILLQMGALFAIYCPVPRLIALLLPLTGALIAFLVNGFRIMILAILTNAQNKSAFDYWHEGMGEQVFSIISMVLFGLLCEWIWEQTHTQEKSETN